MTKKLTVVILIIILALGVAVASFAIFSKQTNAPANQQPLINSGTITVTGSATCLPPKDTTAPTATSCAVGLKADNGKTYALDADDPTVTGSVPTGQQIKVIGTLTEQTSQYDSVGTIMVDSLQRL